MATQEESKLDKFKLGTKKFIGRTNERLKQRMGRSGEQVVVKDDKWQVHVANFNRQQALALKLHREVKGYIASLKTLEGSAHTLMEVVREMHEFTWPGNMNLVKALQSLEKLNTELSGSMVDTLLVPVNNYVEQFPEIKERMNKRDRKLLDYTRCKRQLDTLKKGDKISPEKLGQAQEEFTEHKMIYEEVNTELSEDLPEFWDCRKPFISRFLDSFFEQNVNFSKEFSQVYSECHAAVEPLKEAIRSEPPATRPIGNVDRFFIVSDQARKFKRQSMRKSFRKSGGGGGFKRSLSMGAIRKQKSKDEPVPQSMSNITADPYAVPTQQANVYTTTNAAKASISSPVKKEYAATTNSDIGNESSVTPFSPTFKVEAGATVECIHEYAAVDDDELTFATGDVITVVDWDSTDEQDEGWFMGVLKSTGKKGAFPINYTRKFTGAKAAHSTPSAVGTKPAHSTPSEKISNGVASDPLKVEYVNMPDSFPELSDEDNISRPGEEEKEGQQEREENAGEQEREESAVEEEEEEEEKSEGEGEGENGREERKDSGEGMERGGGCEEVGGEEKKENEEFFAVPLEDETEKKED